jgi:hypothetical protein
VHGGLGGGSLTSAGGGDILVAKLDPSGNHLWSTRYGDASNQQATATAIDSADNVVVTGYLHDTVDFGNGPLVGPGGYNVFLAKLAP